MNLKKKIDSTFEEAVARVQSALKEQGFGILTEIDVKETLKKKLDVDYPNYKILGACNPHLAKRALDIDQEIGTLLPCNVIVYETDDGIQISIQNPIEMMEVLENEKLDEVAQEAESKLRKVLESL
ncbi:MAG: DUF302 domain-containing protein [Candidatus Bathyarchaeota archaeon]|nr:DUF302 domain-containing protein [Candidatus Bathyarchaeota archaeon]